VHTDFPQIHLKNLIRLKESAIIKAHAQKDRAYRPQSAQ
jgi:hypothetical protein